MSQSSPDSGRRDYATDEIEAAKRVLAELMQLLAEYRHGIVLIGGWVPFFAIPHPKTAHEGTKDVDLVLNPAVLRADGDETIEEILMKALYQQDEVKRFRWYRGVTIGDHFVKVIVDFLAPESDGFFTGQLRAIQDIHASTMRGCEVAFLDPVEVPLQANKPDGTLVDVSFQMTSVTHFLTLKGLAFHNRDLLALRDENWLDDARKDAYDIYFIVRNYENGLNALVEAIRPHLNEPKVRDGFQKIAAKWQSVRDRGPVLVALREQNREERERLQRDVYEQVRALLNSLGLI